MVPTCRSPTRLVVFAAAALSLSCSSAPETPANRAELVALGESLFFTETFDGNGRTCGTCHRREDNFGLSPAFIATLPEDDALFVAERQRALAENFEKPERMRRFGVILENQDGFDDLAGNFNLRGVPHLLGMAVSVDSADGPRTGWAGDGAPGDGSLRAFAVGAIIQHYPRTLNRVAGRDFRLPTALELDALEAFMLTLGRQRDLELPLALNDRRALRGQALFLDNGRGKCNVCHFNAGANADEAFFGMRAGNRNFDTGLPGRPGDPDDDGFGVPGNREFNTPPLVEAADTGPFFHNNTFDTLEAAVAFYNTPAFNGSPAGQALRRFTGGGIALSGADVQAVTTFLRAINALENIRASVAFIDRARVLLDARDETWRIRLDQARHETEDAVQVLQAGQLHEGAVAGLERALAQLDDARERRGRSRRDRARILEAADATAAEHAQARAAIVAGGEA